MDFTFDFFKNSSVVPTKELRLEKILTFFFTRYKLLVPSKGKKKKFTEMVYFFNEDGSSNESLIHKSKLITVYL